MLAFPLVVGFTGVVCPVVGVLGLPEVGLSTMVEPPEPPLSEEEPPELPDEPPELPEEPPELSGFSTAVSVISASVWLYSASSALTALI